MDQRLLKRARAAYWNRFWLLLSTLVTVASFLMGPNVEDFISGVLLAGMTVAEYKVRGFFLAGDPRGPTWGWWNQCLFSLLFIIYGTYHGVFVHVSPEISDWLDPSLMPTVVSLEQSAYFTIGAVGAIGQFCLACYYRSAARFF